MNRPAPAASVPDPTAALFLLAGSSVLLWASGSVVAGMLLPSALLAAIFIYWIFDRPDIAVVITIIASVMPRFFVPIASLKARPEHLVGVLLCLTLPLWWIFRKRRPAWIAADYLVMAYVAMNFISSLFASVAPGQTIRWATQQALAISPYFVLRTVVDGPESFRRAVRGLLLVGAVEAAYATVCFFSNHFFGTEFGVEPFQYGDLGATYGSQFEANILGAFCGACCVMMLAVYLYNHQRRYLVGYALSLMGVAVSLSRAAAIATAVATITLAIFAVRRGLINRKAMVRFAVATLCVAILLAPILLQSYVERFSTIDVADVTADPNTLTRAVQLAIAVENVRQHPIFGNGTASFQLLFSWRDVGADWDDQGWIGNAPLRMLHDTGVVGLSMFALFILYLGWRSWKILRKGMEPEFVALLFAAIVYCITFQATEGTILAFSWVHLGLIGCAVAIYGKNAKTAQPERHSQTKI